MSLLIISVLTLVLGPLLYRVADAARPALLVLDGFIMLAVSGLVVVHIIPHAFAVAGILALLMALLGFLGPSIIERYLHGAARAAHTATLIFACLGLVVHAFIDGVAMGTTSTAHHGESSLLAIAVVLHRLPVAITVWWLLRPASGALAATLVLAAMGGATVTGYGLSGVVESVLSASWAAAFQALVAGSLLHVIVHRPPVVSLPSHEGREPLYAGLGAMVGLLVVIGLANTHHIPLQPHNGTMGFGDTFWALALESAPALLLAFALAGLVQVFMPQASLRWMRAGGPWGQSARGMAFGLPLPICSCGVIPLYRSLVLQGAPATAGMAFLVATPELGLDAILISLPLLGGELAMARLVAAALVALAVGVLVGKLADAARGSLPTEPVDAPAVVRGSVWNRVRLGLRYGFGEIVDHVGPWLLLGLVIASLVEPLLSGRWLTALPWGADVVLFALLGMPTYVCASGATPLVAVLLYKGISPGAALAFLLAGPATNITTFGVLAQLHGRRIAMLFASTIAGLAVGLGILLNLILGDASGMQLHEFADTSPGILSLAALVAVAGALLLSVLRQGPRGFVGQVISPYDDRDSHCHDSDCHDAGAGHGHGHDHDHAHGHEHALPASSSKLSTGSCGEGGGCS